MELIRKVQSLLAYKADRVHIDELSFKLHYRFTSTLLFICAVLVTSHQYIGDPIDCFARSSVPLDRLDRYCWVQKTFSVPTHWEKKIGTEVAYPGVAEASGELKYHAYYQWVCFVLFLQSLLFYIPHRLWKHAEGGRVKRLTKLIENQLEDTHKLEKPLRQINRYLVNYRGDHRVYGVSYVLCEFLNLVNVIAQLFLMDSFLGGDFFAYGIDWLSFSGSELDARLDPMIKRFPRVAQCTLHTFGSGGSVQDISAICFLHVNILNEKIFLVLWIWFYLVAVATVCSLVYRAMVIVNFRHFRWLCLRTKDLGFDYGRKVRTMACQCEFGDFVLLHLLSKNIDRIVYSDLLKAASDAFDDVELRSVEAKKCFTDAIVIDSTCTKVMNGTHRSQQTIKRHSTTDL